MQQSSPSSSSFTHTVNSSYAASSSSPSPSKRSERQEVIRSINFNQDYTCLSVSTSNGYRIYSLRAASSGSDRMERSASHATAATTASSIVSGGSNSAAVSRSGGRDNVIELLHSTTVVQGNGTLICQLLYCTSLIVVVYAKNPRLLSVEDASMNKVRCERAFETKIVRVELNRMRLVVLTADGMLHVFDLATMKLLSSIPVVASSNATRLLSMNYSGVAGMFFKLSDRTNASGHSNWLVCRNVDMLGSVKVYNAISVKMENIVKAHVNEVAHMALGGSGSQDNTNEILVTASSKGTIIRIFALPNCQELYSVRRGMSSSHIYSIALDPCSRRLLVSSSTGTVHLFNIENKLQLEQDDPDIPDCASSPVWCRSNSSASIGRSQNRQDGNSSLEPTSTVPYVKICLKSKIDKSSSRAQRNMLAFLPGDYSTEDVAIIVNESGEVYSYAVGNMKPTPLSEDDLLLLTDKDTKGENGLVFDM
eukprot:CAMPEP_0116058562 /NCGR_PEP_ID=MMETSP0322-20121206/5268_1 /TAXON_ID=163516 /ORGANISM="Leptocylindrus danicus var. apora, Strain B651" /LENGTH=478 /DNA_ID=CAMNT_0003542763 /DNA_START=356 /DNA_END=1792 /DNA_ORIENTATION=-